ncbi:hypothetical protein [Actinomyces wuliandei]|uniref:hypothetical protein n=1 Tax=Actinomyces wuliandei TaxID=2057743 RepID=UPI0011196392|nr:hypothetical protein [Actinomyces wuliandei]
MDLVHRFTDRLTPRAKTVLAVLALVTATGLGVAVGTTTRAPAPATQPTAATTPAPTPTTQLSLPPGDSTDVTSSTGTDYGASLPRLDGSTFARTTDPSVFAASVRAGQGYDYTTYQPDDTAAEADRINTEILAGMTGTDGPLGPELHDWWRSQVTRGTDLDRLEHRIRARTHNAIDITEVTTTDNDTLHDDVGDATYMAVLHNRHQGIYQLSVTATVTTTVQAVDDQPGHTRSRTNTVRMLVHCPDTGWCTLIAVTGKDAS